MAFTVEAYYEQRTNNDVLDRIEIQQDGGAGRNLELEANSQGFRYRLSEITSESDDGLINPLANKIQVGKLTFFPKIESAAEETLLDDILGSPDNTFRIVWKQDGSVTWTGYIDNKKRSYPETGGLKFTEIRASDFELLKTIDYALDDTRQTLITTIADLLGNLSFGYDIRTATSWITEDTTDSTDFLSQIYHETKALREFARTGDESDQPISVWDALVSVGDPALLFRQVNGEFTVEQLTAFSDPENVSETLYDSTGAVDTATADVDRRLTGFTSTDSGSLVVKNGSQNDIYPGIKRAKVVFDHRTQVSGIELPSDIDLVDSGTEAFTQLFIGDGTQNISLSFDVYAETDITQASMDARFRILIDTYYLQDDGSWDTMTNSYYEVSLTKGKPLVGGGNVWRGSFSILTDDIPDAADGTLTLQFAGATGDVDFANDTLYTALSFKINNPVASENSTTIHYQLTQSDGYSTNFTLNNTWFGDGPTGYSVSALRYGTGDGQVTADTWQRRGSVAYRSFHENLLKEILDLQRTNTRKLNAEFWGQYDPSKILVYDSQNFYCAGVSYTGVLGRWSANLFRVNVQTGTDTFEDIPKFTDETGSGSGSASTGGGGGGGISQATADDRYLNESENGADIPDVATFRNNINLGSAQAVTFGSATLSNLTSGRVAYAGASGLLQDSANLTFNGTNLALASATFGANNALTGSLGDARYGQLGSSNTWMGTNEYNGLFRIARFDPVIRLMETDVTDKNWQILLSSGDLLLQEVNDAESSFNSRFRFRNGGNFDIVSGDLRIGTTTVIDSSRNAFFAEGTFSGDVEKDNFALTTDFDGTGWQGNSAGDFNIRNLVVRESARFRELIIDQLSIIAGSDLLSVARGKIESIDTNAKTVTIEDPNDRGATRFVVNDFFWVKSVDIDNSTIVDLKGQITAVSGTTLTLDTTVTGGTHDGGTTDITSLTVGDVITQRGHPSNADRQSLIYRTVSDSDAPVEKFFDGIDSLGAFDTASNIVVEIGPTSGHFGANNILTYSPDSVTMASFVASGDQLKHEGTSGATVMGDTSGTGFYGFGVTATGDFTGSDNFVRIFINDDATSYGFQALDSNGDTVARFGSTNEVVGWSLEPGKFFGGDVTDGFTGLQSGTDTTRTFFCGASDNSGTDATFYVQADGRFFSEAASDAVWTRTELATFGNNTGASSITDEEWQETVTRATNGPSTNEHDKIITVSKKRFSKDTLVFTGVGRQAGTGSGTATVERDVEIRAAISSVSGAETASGSTVISQTSDEEFSFEVDISSIPDNDMMLIEISIWVSVTISNSDAVTYGTQGFLREDVVIMTST